jgi:hypothetical protein
VLLLRTRLPKWRPPHSNKRHHYLLHLMLRLRLRLRLLVMHQLL